MDSCVPLELAIELRGSDRLKAASSSLMVLDMSVVILSSWRNGFQVFEIFDPVRPTLAEHYLNHPPSHLTYH
jgi:hypothetical protein